MRRRATQDRRSLTPRLFTGRGGDLAVPRDRPRRRCEIAFKPQGRWRCNGGQAMLDAAPQRLGICQLPNFYVDAAIADGRL